MIDPTSDDGGLAEAAGIVAAKHGDPMRIAARPLSPEAVDAIGAAKCLGTLLYGVVAEMPRSREQALALTKIEEAVMWATKAATAIGGSPDA